jgi:hypothetical protein
MSLTKDKEMKTEAYVYIQSEFGEYPLWTVGFYNPSGEWDSESDHGSKDEAAKRVHYLNGGCDQDMIEMLTSISEENYDDDDKSRHLRTIIDRMKQGALHVIEKIKS